MRRIEKQKWIMHIAFVLCLGFVICPIRAAEEEKGFDETAETDKQVTETGKDLSTAEALSPNRSKMGQPVVTPPHSSYNQNVQLLVRGKVVYQRYCIGCHGENGDGEGPATPRLLIKPRNFKLGIYKFRSTKWNNKDSQPGPVLPLDEDLKRTITQGLAGSSMPGFPLMPEQDKAAVIAYIKSFYPDWTRHVGRQPVVALPQPPRDLLVQDRIERGRLLYMKQSCVFCHGPKGAGDGPAGTALPDVTRPGEMVNDQMVLIKPANLTKGIYRSGNSPVDLYRVLHASPHPNMGMMARINAIGGATESEIGMLPAMYGAFMDEADKTYAEKHKSYFGEGESTQDKIESHTWDLVAYIFSLSKRQRKRLGLDKSVPKKAKQDTNETKVAETASR